VGAPDFRTSVRCGAGAAQAVPAMPARRLRGAFVLGPMSVRPDSNHGGNVAQRTRLVGIER